MTVDTIGTNALIEELWERGDLALAVRELKRREGTIALFKIGPRVWGLSSQWLAFCFWNGDQCWFQIPFLYAGVGTKNIECTVGRGKWSLFLDIRWRWD